MGHNASTTNESTVNNQVSTNTSNQNYSKDNTINDESNIRNHDIVHGDDIKGGVNTFNAMTNTQGGVQIFKLQELLYTIGPVITSHFSDVSVDSSSTSTSSGSRSGSSTTDSTVTTTVTNSCNPSPYVDYTKYPYFSNEELRYLNNVRYQEMMKDPCISAAQKAGYTEQLQIINQKFGYVNIRN